MYGSIKYDSQRLYLNDQFIEGITDHSSDFEIPETDVVVAGKGYLQSEVEGRLGGQFQFSKQIVSQNDPITGFLGGKVTGEFWYGKRNMPVNKFGFSNGRITEYSISCGVGEPATNSVSLECYGNMGGTGTGPAQSEYSYSNPELALSRALQLDVSGQSTNRIQSIDYNVQIQYNERPFLNQIEESDISLDIKYPIVINSVFVMDVDDYESEKVFDLLCSAPNQNLNFSFEDCQYGDVRKFHSPNAKLNSFSYTSNTDGNMQCTIGYRSKLNSVTGLATILSTNI